jgi:hypothetical protein
MSAKTGLFKGGIDNGPPIMPGEQKAHSAL